MKCRQGLPSFLVHVQMIEFCLGEEQDHPLQKVCLGHQTWTEYHRVQATFDFHPYNNLWSMVHDQDKALTGLYSIHNFLKTCFYNGH